MYDFIIGKIEKKDIDHIVLLNNGIGYKVFASGNTILDLEQGTDSKIYLELIVREDSMSLYGFSTKRERDLYNLLTTVKGIGPRVGIGILSGLEIDTIINAIRNSDSNTLSKAPGVGKKTAERIILELKDKTEEFIVDQFVVVEKPIKDAEEALVQLGYSSYEVKNILDSIYEDGMTVEDLIRQALKHMAR